MVKAYEIATDKFIPVSKEESIFTCGKFMGNSGKKYVVIVDNEKILGIVSGLDIIKKLTSNELSKTSKAINLMSPLLEINSNMELSEVITKMMETGTSQLAVGNKIIDKDTLLEYIYLKK